MKDGKSALLPKRWELPERIHRRLGEGAGRQRLMDEEDHLLLILHQPPHASDNERRDAAFFWRAPDGTWKSTPSGGGLAALEELVETYRSRSADLDRQVDAARDARDYFEVLRELNPMLRATRHLHGVLQEAREARGDDRRLIVLRDRAVDLERAVELAAVDARTGLDFTLAENAQRQAVAAAEAGLEARRLNRLVAFFFPLATLVAVFGMNSPAEVLSSPGFWTVIAVGVAMGLVVLGAVPPKKSGGATPESGPARR